MSEITNLVKKGKDSYLIFVDGSCFCVLNSETIVKAKLHIGQEIDKEELEQIQYENEKLTAFDKSLNYLANIKSEKQIRDYLYQKGYTKRVVEETIEKLKSYKYIDDLAYAKLYVKSYKLTKGKRLLAFELKTKGIDDRIIDEVCENIDTEEDAIKTIAEKYMKNKEKNQKNLSKLFNYLSGKGFEFSMISSFIRKNYNNFSEVEDE